MINQQLLDFIKSQLSKDVDKETITKELLGSGWLEKDIQEGFNTVNIPIVSPEINSATNPPLSNRINNPIITQNSNSSGKKILLIIVALFILAGGVSGYYFRNDIPVIKDLIKNKEMVPLSEIPNKENVEKQNLELSNEQKQGEQFWANYCNSNPGHSQCVMMEAINSKDVKFCDRISEVESKYECILQIDPSKITIQLCDSIPLYAPGTNVYSMGVNVRNGCYSEFALQSYNADYCKKSINVMDAKDTVDDSCLVRLARVKNSPEFCMGIIKNNDKYACLMDIAIRAKDANICETIEETSFYREACKRQVK